MTQEANLQLLDIDAGAATNFHLKLLCTTEHAQTREHALSTILSQSERSNDVQSINTEEEWACLPGQQREEPRGNDRHQTLADGRNLNTRAQNGSVSHVELGNTARAFLDANLGLALVQADLLDQPGVLVPVLPPACAHASALRTASDSIARKQLCVSARRLRAIDYVRDRGRGAVLLDLDHRLIAASTHAQATTTAAQQTGWASGWVQTLGMANTFKASAVHGD